MNNLLSKGDYSWKTQAGMMPQGNLTFDQLQNRMETRASQQVSKDLSYYTGGDQYASKQQAIDDLYRKYQNEIGGNGADLRKKAQDDFERLMNEKLGGKGPDGNPTGPGSSGANRSGASTRDPMSGINDLVSKIYDYMLKSLPQHALS